MPYVAGAMQQLLLQATWDTSDLDVLSLTQQRVFNLISLFNCATAPDLATLIGPIGTEIEDCMGCCLRFMNGKLQSLNCGVWEDIPGQDDPAVPPLQPAGGAPQPTPDGGCQTYHATMLASDRWLVPTPVSTGDTIGVSNLNGASNVDGDLFWFGPNGLLFFGGAYQAGTGAASVTSPVPAELVQGLCLFVGGNFYSLIDGDITIPSGVSNEQPYVMLNTDAPHDLAGTIQFDLTVCNNQQGPWASTLDFTASSYGEFVTAAFAAWTVGIGYEGGVNGSVPHWDQLDLLIDSCSIDTLQIVYDAASVGGGSQSVFFQVNGSGYGTPVVPSVGTAQLYSHGGQVDLVTNITAVVSTGTTGGADKITSMVIVGHGPKPSQLP